MRKITFASVLFVAALPNAVWAQAITGSVTNPTGGALQDTLGDRINQLDVRIANELGRGRTQTFVAIEAYNPLNSSAVLSYNTTFVPGGAWPQPNSILTPRLVKVTAEVTF